MRALLTCALLVAIGLVGLRSSPDARGCAAVSRKGDKVAIATESALIIWDEKTRTQHFIRRASFATQAPYFGFLVPTPAKPDLAEVPDELFESMEDWSKPETVTKTTYKVPIAIGCSADKMDKKDKGGVEVLGRQRVGNFDATFLKADDTKALAGWLGKHGYDSTPALEKWLEPYVKRAWVVTAFQIVKPEQADPRLSTKAV